MGDWEDAHMDEHGRLFMEIKILNIEEHKGINVEDSYIVIELVSKTI